jgi:hypothetical protein
MPEFFTPLMLPTLEPDNWDTFWELWNKSSDFLVKTYMHTELSRLPIGDVSTWRGIDIYNPARLEHALKMPALDIENIFPNMYKNILDIENMFIGPIKVILIESLHFIGAHTDNNRDVWTLRQFFHYPSPSQQWFFTRPNDKDGDRYFITMPPDVKWFAFNDIRAWHGTLYDTTYPKILVKIYGRPKKTFIEENIERYKEYTLSFD